MIAWFKNWVFELIFNHWVKRTARRMEADFKRNQMANAAREQMERI